MMKHTSQHLSNYQPTGRSLTPNAGVSEIPDIPILRALRNTDLPVASYDWRATVPSKSFGLHSASEGSMTDHRGFCGGMLTDRGDGWS
jgi:hypothetical protein